LGGGVEAKWILDGDGDGLGGVVHGDGGVTILAGDRGSGGRRAQKRADGDAKAWKPLVHTSEQAVAVIVVRQKKD